MFEGALIVANLSRERIYEAKHDECADWDRRGAEADRRRMQNNVHLRNERQEHAQAGRELHQRRKTELRAVARFKAPVGGATRGRFVMIENVPQGIYHVVAYVSGMNNLSGGFSQAVPCGLSANCSDHSLIDVSDYENQDTPNVNPTDWYAPEGAFPPNPMP